MARSYRFLVKIFRKGKSSVIKVKAKLEYRVARQSSLGGAMKTTIFHGKLDVFNYDECLALEVIVLKAQRK